METAFFDIVYKAFYILLIISVVTFIPLAESGKKLAILWLCIAGLTVLDFLMISPSYYFAEYEVRVRFGDSWWHSLIVAVSAFCDIIFGIIFSVFMFGVMAEAREQLAHRYSQKKTNKMRLWIKALNKPNQHMLEGTNQILSNLEQVYTSEKQIERLLQLLDLSCQTRLQRMFWEKIHPDKEHALTAIQQTAVQYGIPLQINNKTLGQIIREMQTLREVYHQSLYDEETIDRKQYSSIKMKYKAYKKAQKRNKMQTNE